MFVYQKKKCGGPYSLLIPPSSTARKLWCETAFSNNQKQETARMSRLKPPSSRIRKHIINHYTMKYTFRMNFDNIEITKKKLNTTNATAKNASDNTVVVRKRKKDFRDTG